MAEEPMTLIERLRNPAWSGSSPHAGATLQIERTTADMREAADYIEQLRGPKRPVAFRLQNDLGEWVIYEDEEPCAAFANSCGKSYQGLYVRDGSQPPTIKSLVDRFLVWQLPKTVCSDLCVTDPNYKFPRSGTCLLSADEARQMIEHLFATEAE